MFRDLILALVDALLMDPARAELSERLGALRAPAAVVREVGGCVAAARPALADAYVADPARGAVAALRLWTGLTTYEALLAAEVPACAPALLAARPFLSDTGR